MSNERTVTVAVEDLEEWEDSLRNNAQSAQSAQVPRCAKSVSIRWGSMDGRLLTTAWHWLTPFTLQFPLTFPRSHCLVDRSLALSLARSLPGSR